MNEEEIVFTNENIINSWIYSIHKSEANLEQTIKAASLNGLIDTLFNKDYIEKKDVNFMRDFVITFISICDTRKFFEIIIDKYNMPHLLDKDNNDIIELK